MINMGTWREIVVDVVDDLHLDPHNVRIDLNEGAPEVDIIQDLFRNEKAMNLVDSICKIGLLTHELPIVIRRNRKLVVVEGNRRVAALKSIQNPLLVPDYQARISKSSHSVDHESLRNISVKLAPSQDDANQLIAAIHTGNQRVGWSPARQAAFFQAQIEAGKSAEYLISHYPTVEVRKFIIRSHILNLFRGVNYKDPQMKDYITARTFPVSVLARLYDNDRFLETVGIKVDAENARVELESTGQLFEEIAEKIVGDIKEKRINTRTLNSTKTDTYVDYMGELRDLINDHVEIDPVPDVSLGSHAEGPRRPSLPPTGTNPGTSLSATDGAHRGDANEVPTQGSSTKGKVDLKQKPASTNYLNLDFVVVADDYPPAIRKIHAELSLINIKRFPNATLDLLRTFLEKSIKAYAARMGEDIRKNAGLHNYGYVQLGHCLTWLEEYCKTSGQTSLIQVISKIRGNGIGGYIPTMDHMNAINHNHEVFATAEEVRACWDGMEGLIKTLLKP
jgi:hypothetical protein